MISVRDLRVDYGPFCAVRDLSFEVRPGDVYGLIGPNGCGKTTTFRALLGLVEPTYGDIEVCGIDVRDRPAQAHQVIGFMPDYVPLYDDLTAWEFLDLFAASYFIPKAARPKAIEDHLRLVGLWEKIDDYVGGLSRGMKQRLMLAKTLLPDPEVLLLDEPASGMDPYGRIMLKQVLQLLRARGKAVIVSSHILSEMEGFCTAVLIMERGRLVIGGDMEDVAAEVVGEAAVAVELLRPEDLPRLASLLAADGRCGRPKRTGEVVEFAFAGDRADLPGLIAALLAGGVPVVSFARRRGTLEDIFLQVGAKETS